MEARSKTPADGTQAAHRTQQEAEEGYPQTQLEEVSSHWTLLNRRAGYLHQHRNVLQKHPHYIVRYPMQGVCARSVTPDVKLDTLLISTAMKRRVYGKWRRRRGGLPGVFLVMPGVKHGLFFPFPPLEPLPHKAPSRRQEPRHHWKSYFVLRVRQGMTIPRAKPDVARDTALIAQDLQDSIRWNPPLLSWMTGKL